MRILIVTPHFYPESFKCNEMAFELHKRGYKVSVMTAIPDYPEGKFFEGYGLFRKRKEIVNGVDVHRSLIIPRGSGTALRMVLNYLSYTFFAALKAVWFGVTRKYDAIVVHETSPVMVGIPAVIVKKIQRIPLYFWVLDLWPESLSAAGGINNRRILGLFSRLTKWLYANSDRLLIGSKGFRKSIDTLGDFDRKTEYFPNWIEESLENPEIRPVPDLPKGLNVMIAGNMGDAQDIPHILEAAYLLKRHNINFLFVGDGRKRSYIDDYVKENGLEETVRCLGRFPLESMPSLFAKTDLLFMALKAEPIFGLTVPSRLQAYMSSGKPVVAMIDGEGAAVIAEADCGWSVPAESPEKLAELLIELSKTDSSILAQKGANGKAFSHAHYRFCFCMDHLCSILTSRQ